MDSSIIISIIFGGLITGLFSWIFYMKSAKELEDVSIKLDDRMRCMLIAMENANLAELQRDYEGNIVGVTFTFQQKAPLEAKIGVFEPTIINENNFD
jgi:hypothetical protein